MASDEKTPETLARETVEQLLTNGAGDKADRLVLMVDGPPKRDLGGWGRFALTDALQALVDTVRQQERRALQQQASELIGRLRVNTNGAFKDSEYCQGWNAALKSVSEGLDL